MADTKLKDARMVRIFVSSPFRGMEEERNLLNKIYWPKIELELSQKGLVLRLVDMRWGISSSSMSASDTVYICLREISRSDIFIGLYGQRYGWNGLSDVEYQKNLDRAAKNFPWVNDNRDRSVTELEYLHGFLNDPGAIPACFCFRDEGYDGRQIKLTNLKRLISFSSEDDDAGRKLQDLKSRVEKNAVHTIGLNAGYSTPEEAAEYIYNKVLEYIHKHIFSKMEAPLNDYERTLLAHDTYWNLHAGPSVFGEKYIEAIDSYVQQDRKYCNPLTLIGPTGYGRTAILCNWMKKHINAKSLQSKTMCFYHFVGAESTSASPRHLMERIISFVNINLNGFTNTSLKKLDLVNLVMKTRETLMQMQHPEHRDRRLVIVVANVDNIQLKRSTMPLFWLPKNLPSNIRIMMSLAKGSTDFNQKMQILVDEHKTEKLQIHGLTDEEKKVMCMNLLDENSKSMEPEQLDLIIASPKTNNQLFLVILVSELCHSGRFDTLTQQITELLQCDGLVGLMIKVIERLQRDYKTREYPGNAVEEVLCALCLCKHGIRESEFPVPPAIWAPILIALDQFIIDRGGFLSFVYPEMEKAVENMYLGNIEKKQMMAGKIASIFHSRYLKSVASQCDVNGRTASELLHLLRLSENREQLLNVVSDIQIFVAVTKTDPFEVNEYWQWLDTPSDTIARIYIVSINQYISQLYASHWQDGGVEHQNEALERKSVLISAIREWFEGSKMFHGLSYLLDKEIDIDTNRPGLTDLQRKRILCGLKYIKACFLSDIQDYEEALKLHMEVLATRQELMKQNMMFVNEVGLSCNAVGLCYYYINAFDEAEKTLNMGLVIGSSPELKTQQAPIYSNLGLISIKREQYEEARKRFEKSLLLIEESQPDALSLDVAYCYHNLGLTHRHMKKYDMAANYYSRSLNVKEILLGRHSFEAALSIMNLGTLEGCRKNNIKSLEYAQEALVIFEDVAPGGSNYVTMAKENVVNQLCLLGRFAEAEPKYQEICSSSALYQAIHERFIQWYMSQGRVEEAADLIFELVSSTELSGEFVMLNCIERKMPPARKAKGLEWATIEYAYKKWPRLRAVLRLKVMSVMEHTPDQFRSFVEQHCQQPRHKDAEQCYAELAIVLKDDLKDMKKAIEVMTIGTRLNPFCGKLSDILKCLKSS